MSLQLEGVSKSYGSVVAVADLSLEVGASSTVALLGPSGCGKSTLLRLVAGLERPDRGRVLQSGRDVTALPPQRREVGMVFQDYALFPHLDVASNIGFALREARWSRPAIAKRVSELLELVNLAGLEQRRTYELSGGQQQRVALARALAVRPSLLLLDEPLSNLDPGLRSSLQRELRELLSELSVQAIYVTHDQEEAFGVAPFVAVMRAGRIVQRGTTAEVLRCPANAWIARFLGYRNVYPAGSTSLPANEAPLLLRDELVSIGGGLQTRVNLVERIGHRLRLELMVPHWGATISWEGYERELPVGLREGDELAIEVPDQAWVELEDAE